MYQLHPKMGEQFRAVIAVPNEDINEEVIVNRQQYREAHGVKYQGDNGLDSAYAEKAFSGCRCRS